MKPLGEKTKHILIDITVVFLIPVGLFYLYTIFASPGESLFGSSEVGAEMAGEGQKFLVKLNELKALKLDTSVFESTVYKSLVDTTFAPPTEDKGRPHPFIPPAKLVTPPKNPVTKTNTTTR